MPGQRFRLVFEAYFYNISNLIILLNDAMRQAVLSSFHLLTLSKRNSSTFFSFWHIIYSYRRTFQHIHVHIMIYSNVFSPHFLILIFWFLVTEMSSQLLCPSRIGKRRLKGLSLFKGCCCPPFLMKFYEKMTMMQQGTWNSLLQNPAVYGLFVVICLCIKRSVWIRCSRMSVIYVATICYLLGLNRLQFQLSSLDHIILESKSKKKNNFNPSKSFHG